MDNFNLWGVRRRSPTSSADAAPTHHDIGGDPPPPTPPIPDPEDKSEQRNIVINAKICTDMTA